MKTGWIAALAASSALCAPCAVGRVQGGEPQIVHIHFLRARNGDAFATSDNARA